jgi:hypothetical protein
MGIFHEIFSSINLQSKNDSSVINSNTNFYCYSSGCLSLLLSNLQYVNIKQNNFTSVVDLAYDAAHRSQSLWLRGEINQYDIVETFLLDVIINPIRKGYIDKESIIKFLPRLYILITTGTEGAQVKRAESVEELIPLLRKTTWIPFVTGRGFGNGHDSTSNCRTHQSSSCTNITTSFSNDNWFLDGGFSRTIHPPCEHTISVPTNWMTVIYTLNPRMRRETVVSLWNMGLDDSYMLSGNKKGIQRELQLSEIIFSIGTSLKRYITTFLP